MPADGFTPNPACISQLGAGQPSDDAARRSENPRGLRNHYGGRTNHCPESQRLCFEMLFLNELSRAYWPFFAYLRTFAEEAADDEADIGRTLS
jgi:hypothetical protein